MALVKHATITVDVDDENEFIDLEEEQEPDHHPSFVRSSKRRTRKGRLALDTTPEWENLARLYEDERGWYET